MNAIRIITEVQGDSILIPEMGMFSGQQVELLIIPIENEDQQILHASTVHLNTAYSVEETEYTVSDVKERNPAYGSR